MQNNVIRPDVSASASPNIALVKYWGKSDARLNLPLNASLSLTVSAESMRTTTWAAWARPEPPSALGTPEDRASRPPPQGPQGNGRNVTFVLNGVPQAIPERIPDVAEFLRSLSPLPDAPDLQVSLRSENTFPTSCGLASSASGACAAVRCLDELFQTRLDSFSLSALARYVSGSGARSQFPGAVMTVELWADAATVYAERAGRLDDLRRARELSTSLRGTKFAGMLEWTAVPLPVHESLRSRLTGFVAVLDAQCKGVGSTAGMLAVTNCSTDAGSDRAGRVASLLAERLRNVPPRVLAVAAGLEGGDFASIISSAEDDWKEMHQLAEASLGSSYLTSSSWKVYAAICAWREESGTPNVLVTFDAGPNPYIICFREAKKEIIDLVSGLTLHRGDPLVEEFIDVDFEW